VCDTSDLKAKNIQLVLEWFPLVVSDTYVQLPPHVLNSRNLRGDQTKTLLISNVKQKLYLSIVTQ